MTTQDNMQDVFPVNLDFVKGEQPSATKLTGWVKQTDTAFSKITTAVGDPWDYNIHSGIAPYTLSPAKLAQTSIARFAGPSDYASPRGASFQEPITSPTFVEFDGNRNQWCVGFPLVHLTSALNLSDSGSGKVTNMVWGVDIINSSSLVEFSTEKTNKADMQEDGDFHIDYKTGVITTYSVPAADFYFTINAMNMFGPGTPWSTSNVIPHWEQTTSLCYVTVISSVGGLTVYNIEFPKVETSVRDAGSSALAGASEGLDTQPHVFWRSLVSGQSAYYRMPYQLTNNLSAGDDIPEGSISIYEESQGRIVAITDIRYQDEHNIRCECPTGWLTAGNTVRVIVTGSSLAENVHYLMTALRESRHEGLSAGQKQDTLQYSVPISHNSLTDCYTGSIDLGVWTTEPEQFYFKESSFPTNPHPQYLHRSGYQVSDLDGNHANAMRGDIVFAGIYPDYDLDDGNDLATYGIFWGGHETIGPGSNTRLNYEGGNLDDSWGVLDSSAVRYGFSLLGVGAAISGDNTNLGALTYTPWYGTPLYLRGYNSSGICESDGAILGFDLGQQSEMNYIKLMPAMRTEMAEVSNVPVHYQQTSTDVLGITPSLDSGYLDQVRLSADQIREFRFRGVSRNEQARNASESIGASNTEFDQEESFDVAKIMNEGWTIFISSAEASLFRVGDTITLSGSATNDGTLEISNVEYSISNDWVVISVTTSLTDEIPAPAGTQITLDTNEFNQYFVSPGMVGCDFLNLYSNAIFFSDTGDGKRTSFTSLGNNWMNEDGDKPTGIYFYPVNGETWPYLEFNLHNISLGTTTTPLTVGDGHGFSYTSTRGGDVSLSSNSGDVKFFTGDIGQFGIWQGAIATSEGVANIAENTNSILSESNLFIATYGNNNINIWSADSLSVKALAGTVNIESYLGASLKANTALSLVAMSSMTIHAVNDLIVISDEGNIALNAPGGTGITCDSDEGYIVLNSIWTGAGIYPDPATSPTGAFLINEDDKKIKIYAGGSWRTIHDWS